MKRFEKKSRQSLKINSPKKPSPALISLTNIRNPKAVQIFLLMKTILKAITSLIGVKIPLACISFHSLGWVSLLTWNGLPVNIPITIEQKNGFLGGFRLRYNWENLYLEHRTFYFDNIIENGSAPSVSMAADGHLSAFPPSCPVV